MAHADRLPRCMPRRWRAGSDRLREEPSRLVSGFAQAFGNASEVGIRPRMDNAVYIDGHLCVAGVARLPMGSERRTAHLLRATCIECGMVGSLLWCTATRLRSCRDRHPVGRRPIQCLPFLSAQCGIRLSSSPLSALARLCCLLELRNLETKSLGEITFRTHWLFTKCSAEA